MGVVGTVVTIGILVVVGLAVLRFAGPHFRKVKMETVLTELLDKEFRAGDAELIAAVTAAGERNGLSIPEEAVAVRREGKKVRIEVTIVDEADLVVMKLPSVSTIAAEREVTWARGILDNTQEKVDRAVQQRDKGYSSAPLD
jgi:hypothetical protein